MAKQTMGFSSQALQHRTDVKAYHLQVCYLLLLYLSHNKITVSWYIIKLFNG